MMIRMMACCVVWVLFELLIAFSGFADGEVAIGIAILARLNRWQGDAVWQIKSTTCPLLPPLERLDTCRALALTVLAVLDDNDFVFHALDHLGTTQNLRGCDAEILGNHAGSDQRRRDGEKKRKMMSCEEEKEGSFGQSSSANQMKQWKRSSTLSDLSGLIGAIFDRALIIERNQLNLVDLDWHCLDRLRTVIVMVQVNKLSTAII